MKALGLWCLIFLGVADRMTAAEEIVALDSSRASIYTSMCNGEPLGALLADPFDCAQFVQCDNGQKAVVKKCAAGTRWDRQLNLCNHIELVPCITEVPVKPPVSK